jgi:hypothetical protein
VKQRRQIILIFANLQALARISLLCQHNFRPKETAVTLKRLCKAANSVAQGDCEAMYVDLEDLAWMVGQGRLLDSEASAELLDRAPDEAGVRIPTETVLRAVGLFLADRGHPEVLADVEAYLAEADGR